MTDPSLGRVAINDGGEQIIEIESDVIDRAGHCLDEMFRLAE